MTSPSNGSNSLRLGLFHTLYHTRMIINRFAFGVVVNKVQTTHKDSTTNITNCSRKNRPTNFKKVKSGAYPNDNDNSYLQPMIHQGFSNCSTNPSTGTGYHRNLPTPPIQGRSHVDHQFKNVFTVIIFVYK